MKKINKIENFIRCKDGWNWKNYNKSDPIYTERVEQKVEMLKDKLNEIIDLINGVYFKSKIIINPKSLSTPELTLKKFKKLYSKVKYWCNICQFSKPIDISTKEWGRHKHINQLTNNLL